MNQRAAASVSACMNKTGFALLASSYIHGTAGAWVDSARLQLWFERVSDWSLILGLLALAIAFVSIQLEREVSQ